MLGLSKAAARRALATTAAIGLLFASSGCLRLDLALEVRPDDSVGGTFTAAWSQEFLDEVEAGETEVRRSDLDAFLDAMLEGVPDADRSPYRTDDFVGETAEFTGRPLSEFAEFGGDEWGFMRITHEDRRYQLEGFWDLETTGFIQTEELESAEILISVNFPANITDHNGELDGRTVTWRMSPGQAYEMHAEAEEHNGWLWLLVGVVSVAVILALVWLWQWTRMRRYSIGTARD